MSESGRSFYTMLKRISNPKILLPLLKFCQHWLIFLPTYMQTTLGQTIYTKTFQPKNISIQSHQSKETVSIPQQVMTKESKKFVLNLMDISELLGNPEFKTNITRGKVLKIIEDLIDGKKTSKNLSKKYKVDQLFVEQIGKYVTDMKDRNGL